MGERYVIPGFNERVRLARKAAGFAHARDFVEARGWTYSTYMGFENDRMPNLEHLVKLSLDLSCPLDWLVHNRGAMKPSSPALEVAGLVGAGDRIDESDEARELADRRWVLLPRAPEARALIVAGNSMYPRFRDGEVVIYDPLVRSPRELVDEYAVVVFDDDATRKIKILREGTIPGRYTLESHNAPPERNVELRAAHKWLGLLNQREYELPADAAAPRRKRKAA